MTFGTAFKALTSGEASGIRLLAWSEDVVVRVQYPDENSKMTAPYLYVESRFGRIPWNMTQIELFSKDWEIAL